MLREAVAFRLPGHAVIVMSAVAWWISDPLVPVTVRVNVPRVAALVVVICLIVTLNHKRIDYDRQDATNRPDHPGA